MDSLDNELNVQAETRQMQKLQMYQKLVIYTLLKFKWSIIIVFILTIFAGVVFRYFSFKNSHHKYEGSVTLFYTPRASEEVKPLSMNHVLGVFSRQQIFHQLIEEMHLNEKQRAILKKSIEVKLLRDHNDMFVITGIGNSDEYVKQLVNTFVAIGIRNYEEYRTAELRNFLDSKYRSVCDSSFDWSNFGCNRWVLGTDDYFLLLRYFGIVDRRIFEDRRQTQKLRLGIA